MKTIKNFLGSIGIATSLMSLLPVLIAQAQPAKVKSFTQWCQEKESVPAATKHTIDVLLERAGTKDCREADTYLTSLNRLYLLNKEIVDLRPLAGLTNLTKLNLEGNRVSDLQPLATLTELTVLYLDGNKIVDVKPLAGLSNLIDLTLNENQIVDIKPLAKLSNLTGLYLRNNKIANVKPLIGLSKLEELDLSYNPIIQKVCPAQLKDKC